MEKKTQKNIIELLRNLECAIICGDLDELKKLNNSLTLNKVDLKKNLKNKTNPFRTTNPVILACREKQLKVLNYLLSNESKIIENSSGIKNGMILPIDEDDTHHNAFYYAIRSGDSELVQTLISSWPGNYFSTHNKELDEIISRAYEKLKLNNVVLSNEISFYVEKLLIDLRFNAVTSQRYNNINDYIKIINERVTIVIESSKFIKENYPTTDEIDEEFLYKMKFIVQNINVLKNMLKSTYDRLPWEEIEFCLIIFISTHLKKGELNVFCNATFANGKILNHLENFVKYLQSEIENLNVLNIGKLTAPIKQKRSIIVSNIINSCPAFKELYEDYRHIRDLYSLEKISETLKLGLTADVSNTNGKLVVTRIIQVLGEYMKNTLESPKLSDGTNELLLASLPKSTRKVVLTLRDSISHIDSLFQRTKIENNKDDVFFRGILNDLKGIGSVVDDVLQARKANIFKPLINEIRNAESCDEYGKLIKIFKNIPATDFLNTNFNNLLYDRIRNLIDELSRSIPDQTDYEKQLFQEIFKTCNSNSMCDDMLDSNFQLAVIIKMLTTSASDKSHLNDDNFRDLTESKVLKIDSTYLDAKKSSDLDFSQIGRLLINIYASVESRSVQAYVNDVRKLLFHIMGMIGSTDTKWMQDLEYKLKEKELPSSSSEDRKTITNEMCRKELSMKLSELKRILNKSQTSNQYLLESFETYKKDNLTQAAVEMLILDIISILSALKINFGMDYCFVDSIYPVLVGKCLRNHLAHNNELVTLFLDDPDRTIFLNAIKLVSEKLLDAMSQREKKELEKREHEFVEDISGLKMRHENSLQTLNRKRLMFVACEKGNLIDLKISIQSGADVNSRCREDHNVLHFASKGGNIAVLQFLLGLNQNLSLSIIELEVAVSNGRTTIVEFIVEKIGMHDDDRIKYNLPLLHTAAKNGHKDVVEVLIKNKYDPKQFDTQGLAIHYAAQYNHKNVVDFLLRNGNTIDDKNIGGFSLLHIAADFGYIELVKYLLDLGADVHAKTDREHSQPLHLAAIHGHFEVIKLLISKGADVNARILNGLSSLYFATETNYANIVSLLLEHGANVNSAGIMCKYTSLHIACEKGYKDIVDLLLENGATGELCNKAGSTPMQIAVKFGHNEIFTILFDRGFNIHTKTYNHDTLLHSVAESGQKAIADKLISSKLKINAINMQGVVPLHIAAYHGHLDIVDLLINNGASVNLQNIVGETPLHAAVINNHTKIIEKLIKSKVKLDVENKNGVTPLGIATLLNHTDAITLLIEHGAEVISKVSRSPRDKCCLMPLYLAIMEGSKNIFKLMSGKLNFEDRDMWSNTVSLAVEFDRTEIVEFLIDKGADYGLRSVGSKVLENAVSKNNKKMLEILIKNEDFESGRLVDELLFSAVEFGHADIVDFLLRHGASVDENIKKGTPLLVNAVRKGYYKIIKSLIGKCKNVNAATDEGVTALHIAALLGHKEIVEILLDNGANINPMCDDGTPLHLAAGNNDKPNIVELLLSRGADANIEDKKNRIAVQLAVAKHNIDIVNILLSGSNIKYLNYKGTVDGLTLLHIAVQRGNMDMIRYLVDRGADIDIKNNYDSKPIHHAAREGYTDIVKFFLSKGSCVNDPGLKGQTLLYYATCKNQIEMVEYLISKNANVNAQTTNGHTPLHHCVLFDFEDVARVLLNHGAMYNMVDDLNTKPIDIVKKQEYYIKLINGTQNGLQDAKSDNIKIVNKEGNKVVALLRCTENLIKAVKRNEIPEVIKCIEEGAIINAKDVNENTSLHYAAWKGYTQIVEILLKFNANANATIKDGNTPLHYAAKFSHIDIVKILLSHGVIYNLMNNTKSIPLELATDETIINILRIIDDSFKYVQNRNNRVLREMEKIKDANTVKAILNARNTNNKSLLMVAMLSGFPKIKEFKAISLGHLSSDMIKASILIAQEEYNEALEIYQNVLEKMKAILGPNNFALLDVKKEIGLVLYKQGNYNKALDLLTEVFNLQKEFLGSDYIDSLNTSSAIALVLHRQGKNKEALEIYKDIYEKQKQLLEPSSNELTNTQLHMALVLNSLERHEEALKLNYEVYETLRKEKGEKYSATLCAKNNIAMVLTNMRRYDKAIQIYEEVYKIRVQVLGRFHSDTIRPLHNIASVYMMKGSFQDAIIRYEQVFDIQKRVLGLQHCDTINTQFNIGVARFKQGKHIAALKIFEEYLRNAKHILGPSHPDLISARAYISLINSMQKFDESKDVRACLKDMQRNLNIAAVNGEDQTVRELINNGADVNDVDEDGRSALYYAVYNGKMKIVKILLENSANIFQVTNKGNTLFHAAASKGYEEIMEVLLQHAEREKCAKVIEIINTRTLSSGSASLHVAAKNGSYEIVKSLLKRGAVFEIINNEGLIPSEISKNKDIIELLSFVEDVFNDAVKGDGKSVIIKFKAGHFDHVTAAKKARNLQCLTLLQVVLLNCDRKTALHLVEMLKNEESISQ